MHNLPPIFSTLTELDQRTALQRMQQVNVEKGVTIIQEGDEDPTCVWVLHGDLAVYTGDTKLSTLGSGELIGEMALFTGGVRTASVVTNAPCSLLVLERRTYEWMREVQHPFAILVEERALQVLTDRLRKAGDRIAALASGTDAEHVLPEKGFFESVASLFGGGGLRQGGRVNGAELLASSPLFTGETKEVLAEVASAFSVVSANTGHFFCTEGKQEHEMYLISSGLVDVIVATSNNRVEQIATLEPGEAFGMCSLLQPGQPRMASCVAKEHVVALCMDQLQWAKAANAGTRAGSALRVAMIRALCDQLSYANAQLAMLHLTPPDDLSALHRASAGVEAHGRYMGSNESVPDYLRNVE